MADEAASSTPTGRVETWLKTVIGTFAGLLSGATLMYLTPLIDRVVKPAKPVANFGHEANGLTVTFHNRSSGGSSGWWDFGDGSPLEPLAPNQDILTHVYPRAGDFTAKLTLRNLLGDEHERAVVVRLEQLSSEPPSISDLEVLPISPGSYAPATFRFVSRAKNAQLYVWDLGDDRPLEIGTDKDHGQEKLATFEKPGAYVVKLAAVSGTQAAVKSDIVQVNVPPVGTVTAMLHVTDQATRVETITTPYTFFKAFPPSSKETVYRVDCPVPARSEYAISDVRVGPAGGSGPSLQGKSELVLDAAAVGAAGARNLRLQLAPDRRLLRLTGELVRDTGTTKRNTPPPTLTLPVVLTQERRSSVERTAPPVTATLTVPGSALLTMPPLPPNWVEPRRQTRLELREGGRVIWQDSPASRSAVINLQNRRCVINTSASGNQVRVDLVELPAGAIPATE